MTAQEWTKVAALSEVESAGCRVIHANGHTIALFAHQNQIFAVDNRCPHMGFPLDKGSVSDGILTCHWHHARFDLASGGTFDQFADDVRSFSVEIRDGYIWLDVKEYRDLRAHQSERLRIGLERNIRLVIGKAIIPLLDGGGDPIEPFRVGLEFGTRNRRDGWGQGLTMQTCFMNMLPHLNAEDRARALYQGLTAVAVDSDNHPPRFAIPPLPDTTTDIPTLKNWFRKFIEVRDEEGAERCIISALRAGADHRQMADMLFAAATDHRYIQIGHVADFTNKAFEALDIEGWTPSVAESALTSLARGYAFAPRMEEANEWRYPIDLIVILDRAFDELPAALAAGEEKGDQWNGEAELVPVLLADDPHAIAEALLECLRNGCPPEQLAGNVAYAAALRIAQFHTSNEFTDWDTALHTFSFANAIQMGLRRAPSVEITRGLFDAAMSVYLDRFLNVPAARLPQQNDAAPEELLAELPGLLDLQQQVNESGNLVGHYLLAEGDSQALLATLGQLLLREDRDFHTIQTVGTAFNQYQMRKGTIEGTHILVAAARYLAAHAPTVRAQGQTYQIAQRLHSGDKLFEG